MSLRMTPIPFVNGPQWGALLLSRTAARVFDRAGRLRSRHGLRRAPVWPGLSRLGVQCRDQDLGRGINEPDGADAVAMTGGRVRSHGLQRIVVARAGPG